MLTLVRVICSQNVVVRCRFTAVYSGRKPINVMSGIPYLGQMVHLAAMKSSGLLTKLFDQKICNKLRCMTTQTILLTLS